MVNKIFIYYKNPTRSTVQKENKKKKHTMTMH